MPRPDGFPTNKELQKDFALAARDLFVAAFEHDLQHKLPRWLVGKKLGHLSLEVTRTVQFEDTDTIADGVIGRERLLAGAALLGFEADKEAEQMVTGTNDPIAIVEERFKDNLAMLYGEMPINDGFSISDIPADLVVANYYAEPIGSKRKRHASATKDRPSKQSLVSGIYFAEEALSTYVRTADFETPPSLRLHRSLVSGMPISEYSHRWTVPFRSDVDISGDEPIEFLAHYLKAIAKQIDRVQNTVDQYTELRVPDVMLRTQKERIVILEHKRQLVMDLLRRKNP